MTPFSSKKLSHLTIASLLFLTFLSSCSAGGIFGNSKNSGGDTRPSDDGEGIGGYLVDPSAVIAFKRSGSEQFILSGDKMSLSQKDLTVTAWKLPDDRVQEFTENQTEIEVSELEEVYHQSKMTIDTFSLLLPGIDSVVVHIYEGDNAPSNLSLSQRDTFFFTKTSPESDTHERVIAIGCSIETKPKGIDELYFKCGEEDDVFNVLDKIVFNICENGGDDSLKAQLFCSDYPYEALIDTPARLLTSSGFNSIGDVNIEIVLNDEKVLMKELFIMYKSGLSPPTSCDDGTEIFRANEFSNPSVVYNHASGQSPQTFASYRLCRSFIVGNHREMTASGVLVANPGPVCAKPPCTPPQSSGDGTFNTPVDISGAASFDAKNGKIFDVNGDGQTDYVVVNFNVGSAVDSYVYYGLGNGQFNTPAATLNTSIEGAYGLAIADFDNDTFLDVFVSSHTAGSDHFIFWGQNSAGFASVDNVAKGSANQMHGASAGDLNGDGFVDIAVGSISPGARSHVYMSNGSSIQTPSNIGANNYVSENIVLADFDKDSDLDVFQLNGTATANADFNNLYLNPGDGDFSTVSSSQLNHGQAADYALAVGDIDRDGNLDSVLCSTDQSIKIFYGKGDGSFDDPVALNGFTNDEVIHCVLADLNNDNYLDLVVARRYEKNFISFGKGGREFDNPYNLTEAKNRTNHIALGDLNGDQKIDIIFVNENVDQVVIAK